MVGAVCGDIIGSRFEGFPIKSKRFELFSDDCRFTDDSVLTVAVADRLLHGGSYVDRFHDYFHRYPHAGYGGSFIQWAAARRREPYNSWGNGSAMRVSPVGFLCNSEEEVLDEARRSAEVTHSHEEGVKGAQATALSVFLARTGSGKEDIRREIGRRFDYRLDRTLDEIRPDYRFDVSCQGSVPESILAFLESEDFEDAVRNAVSLGGDTDTMAAVAGAVAEAFYGGVPDAIRKRGFSFLPEDLASILREAEARAAET